MCQTVRFSPFTRLQSPLPVFAGVWQTSQVCRYHFAHSPRSIDPDGTCITSRFRLSIAACDLEDGIGFRSIYLTGLYRFTLSHCGSCTPLPTLKPHLTAPAPRLSTGCSLRFAGFDLSPNYITCTELARPLANIISYSLRIIKIFYLYHSQLPAKDSSETQF